MTLPYELTTFELYQYDEDNNCQQLCLTPNQPSFTTHDFEFDPEPRQQYWSTTPTSYGDNDDVKPVVTMKPRKANGTKNGENKTGAKPKPQKKRVRRRIITPTQRCAANVRERRRMDKLNGAFDCLRAVLPRFPYERQISRIETLKLSILYIQFMWELLGMGHNYA